MRAAGIVLVCAVCKYISVFAEFTSGNAESCKLLEASYHGVRQLLSPECARSLRTQVESVKSSRLNSRTKMADLEYLFAQDDQVVGESSGSGSGSTQSSDSEPQFPAAAADDGSYQHFRFSKSAGQTFEGMGGYTCTKVMATVVDDSYYSRDIPKGYDGSSGYSFLWSLDCAKNGSSSLTTIHPSGDYCPLGGDCSKKDPDAYGIASANISCALKKSLSCKVDLPYSKYSKWTAKNLYYLIDSGLTWEQSHCYSVPGHGVVGIAPEVAALSYSSTSSPTPSDSGSSTTSDSGASTTHTPDCPPDTDRKKNRKPLNMKCSRTSEAKPVIKAAGRTDTKGKWDPDGIETASSIENCEQPVLVADGQTQLRDSWCLDARYVGTLHCQGELVQY